MNLDVAGLLAHGAPGGVVDASKPLDEAAVATAARDADARLAVLRGPASKAELLDQIAAGLGFPVWFGRNWDALSELLRFPEPPHEQPILVAWLDPARLATADEAAHRTALEVFARSARDRRDAGDPPLVLLLEPPRPQSRGRRSSSTPAVPDRVRRLGKVHHVALIVQSIDDALRFWRDALGLEVGDVQDMAQDRVRIAFLDVGESKVELVEPTDDTTGVARFLASKGEGFHHVCFEVANLAETLLRLEIDGVELIDTAPRKGAEGPVAFLHPRSCHGVLVELIEAPGGPAWSSLGYR